MTKGKFDTTEKLLHPEVSALFGYLIRCNNQMHDFQKKVIKEYLERKDIPYDYVRDVIFFKEDAVGLETALFYLQQESGKIQKEVLFYMIIVSEIDGITDFEEHEFFQGITNRLGADFYDEIYSVAVKKADTERKRFKKSNSTKNTGKRANPNSTDNIFRITQKEYVEAIDRCRAVARYDYKTVKPISDSIVDKSYDFYINLDCGLKNTVDFHPEVMDALSSFSKAIEKEIFEEAKDYRREFAKKETAVEDFTIALIGRTKAGKSTLRAILTGEGKEDIGIGAQRTTRINYVYEWNHLRIIDTPGIDAGSDDDLEDQKIAEKVIGESDVICYIAASDGLPKNAREFAVNIAKRNKPVIVLVNYKNNIGSPSRLKRFLENPSAWRQDEDANSINGYFYPIKRMAEEHNVGSLVSYHSVFLYAELLSREEQFAAQAKVLRDNSGVNDFLATLKDAVVNKGVLLRSKTIIDDTINQCRSWEEKADRLVAPINNMYESLSNERVTTEQKLKGAQIELLRFVEQTTKDAFKKLATVDASSFAEDHYFDKRNISSAWNTFYEEIRFEEILTGKIQDAFSDFIDELKTTMADLFEDLEFTMSDFRIDKNIPAINIEVPLRELFRFAAAGLGIAGVIIGISNPVGWILTGAGMVVAFVAQKFKKKSDREKTAKTKLYNKINSTLTECAAKQIPEILGSIREQSNDAIEKVLKQYDSLLKGLECASENCDKLISGMDLNINDLNVRFAERILEYVYGRHYNVDYVERIYGERMTIYLHDQVKLSRNELNKTKGLLNEQIILKNIQEEHVYG